MANQNRHNETKHLSPKAKPENKNVRYTTRNKLLGAWGVAALGVCVSAAAALPFVGGPDFFPAVSNGPVVLIGGLITLAGAGMISNERAGRPRAQTTQATNSHNL